MPAMRSVLKELCWSKNLKNVFHAKKKDVSIAIFKIQMTARCLMLIKCVTNVMKTFYSTWINSALFSVQLVTNQTFGTHAANLLKGAYFGFP